VALSADALTTVATVLDEIDLAEADSKTRTRVERYINAASSLVRSICGRQLTYAAGIVEKRPGFGGCRLLLDRTPIVAVASVVVDGDTLDASEYEIEDAAVGFVFRAAGWPDTALITATPSGHAAPGTEAPSIVVTYTGGWVTPAQATVELPRTLPHAIEDAVVELVTSRWRRRNTDLRVVGQTFEQSSYTYGGVAVPAEVMAALAPYVRVPNA
jgi:hypothetical protein